MAAALTVLGAAGAGDARSRRSSRWVRALTAKIAAVAVVTVAGATAAAAATGSLPAPAQTAVSDAASHLGISVPEADHHGPAASTGAPTGHRGAPTPKVAGSGQDANTFGQCTAFLAGTAAGKDASTAFKDFIAEHDGTVASTTSFCNTFLATRTAGHGQAGPGTQPSTTDDAGGRSTTSDHPGRPADKPATTSTTHPGDGGGHGAAPAPSSAAPRTGSSHP